MPVRAGRVRHLPCSVRGFLALAGAVGCAYWWTPGGGHLFVTGALYNALHVDFNNATAEGLRETIGQLHALELAVRHARLQAVAAYDERELWAEDGSTSMSVWLSAFTGTK